MSLDAAWARCEAASPGGGSLTLTSAAMGGPDDGYYANFVFRDGRLALGGWDEPVRAFATAVEALNALADALEAL